MERLYQVARQLLLVKPDQIDGAQIAKAFRGGLSASAVCLVEASTAELSIDGSSQYDLRARTKQSYILAEDADDEGAGIIVRCLRVGDPSWARSALNRRGMDCRTFVGPCHSTNTSVSQASQETAAAQAETFRTAILYALCHEFKTPLAAILAVVEVCRSHSGSARKNRKWPRSSSWRLRD
jgi:hypothetical protein